MVDNALVSCKSDGTYLEGLAQELHAWATPTWFHTNTGMADVFVLAFRYLDIDNDGKLSGADLLKHVSSTADSPVEHWLSRWSSQQDGAISTTDYILALQSIDPR